MRPAADDFARSGQCNGRKEARTLAGTKDRPRPNDPCPCGSGKRYADCCGKKAK
ncbi:MAG: SEC-C metal-binding domain-containing protein [Bacteroidota bacterium]